jgi:NAD+ kinase
MTDRPVVGVVGTDVASAIETAESAGATAVTDEVAGLAGGELDALVAVGERAVLDAARAGVSAPVLPVEAGETARWVPTDALSSAVPDVLAGEFDRHDQPVIDVTVAGRQRARGLTDVTLVTSEAAKISEYLVRFEGDRVAQFRADGVIVATPAGSRGYARAAGAPVVQPESGVGPVVPIAPFATDMDHWVAALDDVTLAVARDETVVDLYVDDRNTGAVAPDETIAVSVVDDLSVAVVPETEPWF